MRTTTHTFTINITTGTNTFLNTVVAVAVAATVFFSYNIIYAWTTPTATPPGGNVDAPVNVGSTDQVKAGGLSVNALTTENGLAMPFNNTAWRMVHNDGAGNFEQYINTTGGTSPTYETAGYALKEYYNINQGIYFFQTSGGTAGTAGNPITWTNALKINPNGNLTVNNVQASNYCDSSGGNCFTSSQVQLPSCQNGQTLEMQSGSWTCTTSKGSIFAMGYWDGTTCHNCVNVASVAKENSTHWIVTLSSAPTGDTNYVLLTDPASNDNPAVAKLNATQFDIVSRSSNFNAFLPPNFSFAVLVK